MIQSKLTNLVGGLFAAAIVSMAPSLAQAGSGPSYCHDEATNPLGANRCTMNPDCDGARTCSAFGFCQGTARTPNPGPKGPTYCWNEATNPLGANRCSDSSQCDGARTCSAFGFCQGDAGHAAN